MDWISLLELNANAYIGISNAQKTYAGAKTHLKGLFITTYALLTVFWMQNNAIYSLPCTSIQLEKYTIGYDTCFGVEM